MNHLRRILILAAALASALPARAAQVPLTAYTQCAYGGGLAPVQVVRAAGLPLSRTVDTAAGPRTVTVADGYRVMLAFPGTRPFINLKIERSVAGQHAADRQAILAQLQGMAENSRAALALSRRTQDGIDVVALDGRRLAGGVVALDTLFDAGQEIVATAYLLDQGPGQRPFDTFEDYTALRDRFLRELAACMARLGAP